MKELDPFHDKNLDNRQKDLNELHKKFEEWMKQEPRNTFEIERHFYLQERLLTRNYEDMTIEQLEMLIEIRKSRGAK